MWQLQQTLPCNIEKIKKYSNTELVLLNYHSEDGLHEYIFDVYAYELQHGLIHYFQLITPKPFFYMSYAKNVVHALAEGDILFNLDADNYIDSVIDQLQDMPENSLLIPKLQFSGDTGHCGRIGVHKADFIQLRGYNEAITAMADDDADFIRRAIQHGFKLHYAKNQSHHIKNSQHDKQRFVDPGAIASQYVKQANLNGFAKAQVRTTKGALIDIGYG